MKLTTDIWKKPELTVAFREEQFLEKWGINEMTILEWANRWKQEQDSPVPSFVSYGDKSVEKPDIIVELNGIKLIMMSLQPGWFGRNSAWATCAQP